MIDRIKCGVAVGVIAIMFTLGFEQLFEFHLTRDGFAFLTLIAGALGAALPETSREISR